MSRHETLLLDALAQELAELDLPAPERQHALAPGDRHRLDFAWPELSLCAEVDGGNYAGLAHTRPPDYQRRRSIVAAGWACYWIHADEVMRNAASVARELAGYVLARLQEMD